MGILLPGLELEVFTRTANGFFVLLVCFVELPQAGEGCRSLGLELVSDHARPIIEGRAVLEGEAFQEAATVVIEDGLELFRSGAAVPGDAFELEDIKGEARLGVELDSLAADEQKRGIGSLIADGFT